MTALGAKDLTGSIYPEELTTAVGAPNPIQLSAPPRTRMPRFLIKVRMVARLGFALATCGKHDEHYPAIQWE